MDPYNHPSHPLYPNSTIHGAPQVKPTERRVTYYPFTRYVTEYEERTVMVPVEKTRTKYAEKVIETNYVPKEI